MRTKLLLFVSALFLVSAVSSPAAAYLKIGDIKGEATDPRHKDEIDVLSWSWGETSAGITGGAGGGGRISLGGFDFKLKVNKATPKLMLACATGEPIEEATLTVTRRAPDGGDDFPYLKIKFSNLLISSYQTGGSAGDVIPTDQISFNFSAIRFEYTVEATGEVVEAEFQVPPSD
jgi:type VI secretion system secreted protein Hcp